MTTNEKPDLVEALTVPAGWALVPIEPTKKMREAFEAADEKYEDGEGWKPDMHWKAMIAAAPSAPAVE